MSFFTDWFLNSVIGWVGVAGIVILLCIAIAVYVPPLRSLALAVAAATAAIAGAYIKGARDKNRKWQEAIDRDVRKGEQARADAERDVDAGRVRDKWDRDQGGV